MPRTLISIPVSPWSIKARWALDHHRVEYRNSIYVPMLGEPALRARLGFPRGPVTVPILVDGEAILRESFEIARHAERLASNDSARLFPEGRDPDVARWNGLSDVVARAGRAILTPRLAGDARALEESVPTWIPKPLRRASVPLAELAARYLGRKYRVHEEEADESRRTIRFTLKKLRETLERGDYALGTFSYADVAMASALQFVSPSPRLVRMGEATEAAWTDETLAREHADVLAWRDRIVSQHAPPRRSSRARHEAG